MKEHVRLLKEHGLTPSPRNQNPGIIIQNEQEMLVVS